jgi:hypothetical protein
MENTKPHTSGIFSNIKKINYQPLDHTDFTPNTKKFQEEYTATEVLKDKIYNYDIGQDKFIQLLQQKTSKPRHKTFTNYYYYQYVLSIHNGNKTAFVEKTISQRYDQEKQTHYKETHISSVDILKINLLSSFKFHQMIKIIRFQLKNHCFEIIIPSHSFKIPHQNLFQNLNHIEFPKGTTFIHKKITPVSDIKYNNLPSNETKFNIPSAPKSFNPSKTNNRRKYIPRNRRRAYQSRQSDDSN